MIGQGTPEKGQTRAAVDRRMDRGPLVEHRVWGWDHKGPGIIMFPITQLQAIHDPRGT